MAKIIGLGGVFFNTQGDEKELLKWYQDVLGLDVTEYGIEAKMNQNVLVTLKRQPSNAFINFIVDDIHKFMTEMKQKNVEIVSDVVEYEYGLFSQIKDISGNVIELFQVYQKEYDEMVEKEKLEYKDKMKSQ